MRSRALLSVLVLGLPALAAPACNGTREVFIGFDCDGGPCTNAPAFGSPDAATGDGGEGGGEVENVPMCIVTTCAPPRATCPTSTYQCDVDLTSDNANCGACGVRCGPADNGPSNWTCKDGKCVFSCPSGKANCDGDVTNGCEVATGSDPNNCGDCGTKCDVGDGVIPKEQCVLGECRDTCKDRGFTDYCPTKCTNFDQDDANCGGCGIVCDPNDPNLPPVPHPDFVYGCSGGKCGKLKCRGSAMAAKADCNGDRSDGCEVTLHTNDNCARCGNACAPGKQCVATLGAGYKCFCPDDQETLCGNDCTRLDDDPEHCGGCFRRCPGMDLPHYAATCTHGVCGARCETGYADCDGLTDNGCEANTQSDNRNCGACGHACEPNQVCAEGTCRFAPCDAGAPGETK